jgi:hypothetical protein
MQQEDELRNFMAGISTAESGSPEGDYTARNPSGAYGRFQFMPQYWDDWATKAGYAGASLQDPAAQDAVAAWLMGTYYQDYGSWDLVATAWRLGPGIANRVRTSGWDALDDEQRSIMDNYLAKVRPYVGSSPYMGPTGGIPAAGGELTPGNIMLKFFDEMSNRIAGGRRTSLNDITQVNETALATTVPDIGNAMLLESVVAEGTETFDSAQPGASWSSSGITQHTHATNEARLHDPDYHLIATNTVTPVGQWLTNQFGVSVSQYRPLNFRPQGGAQFSDHYWGGALDVSGTVEQMDAVSAWVEQYGDQIGVDYKLWRTANHFDHVHISFLPPASEGAVTDPTEALTRIGIERSGAGIEVPQNVMPSSGPDREPEPVMPGNVR